MHNVQNNVQPTARGDEVGAWRRLGTYVWRAVKSGGMARAAAHLDQVAYRYEPMHPEFAEELRAASKFADRIALS